MLRGVRPLGDWSIALGGIGTVVAVGSFFVNLGIDRTQGGDQTGDAVGYPGFAGFELEDCMYLLAPITWMGWLDWFFAAAGFGSVIYLLWTLLTLARARAR